LSLKKHKKQGFLITLFKKIVNLFFQKGTLALWLMLFSSVFYSSFIKYRSL